MTAAYCSYKLALLADSAGSKARAAARHRQEEVSRSGVGMSTESEAEVNKTELSSLYRHHVRGERTKEDVDWGS